MKRLPIYSEGKVAAWSLVDDEDFDEQNKHRWSLRLARNGLHYAARGKRIDGKAKAFYLHREILKPSTGMEVDHRDHNGLNNQRANLRVATKSQNQANQLARKATSKYKGVCRVAERSRWDARIMVRGKLIWLGDFKTEKEAVYAYDQAAIQHHGEFALAKQTLR